MERIKTDNKQDPVAASYWENEFMQVDARYTMNYFAGIILDKASK